MSEQQDELLKASVFGVFWRKQMMKRTKSDLVKNIKNLSQKLIFVWTPINEQNKPEEYENVLYFDSRDESMHVGYFVPSQTQIPNYITHFMKLPSKPYKPKEQNNE